LAAGIAASGCSTPGIKLDAPYVSTPQPVVDAMLRVAEVGANDVVYDLGCGDGRIVISAASRFGARGVGVDLDPRRIEEANAAARSAGVSGRVRFVVQDLFKTDFSEASVLALYLFPELNARLLPKIRAELRPGSRVVSYQFGIGDWVPERTEGIWVDELRSEIFLFRVPPR
jgi:SAM-dependent methyltransferase